MDVALSGSSPATMTAGILLLTRARQLGFPLRVSIVGDGDDLQRIPGPAVVYAPVLASCGVGREHGSGATVILPGPPGAAIRVSLTPHGVDGWFLVDRSGEGVHPATQAFVRLSRDPRPEARRLGRDLRRMMEVLGLSADTAVFDVLFGAPVPPLLRVAVALRAGRAISGGRGDPITRFLAGNPDLAGEVVPPGVDPHTFAARYHHGDWRWVLDGLSIAVRDRVEDWVQTALWLARDDGGRDLPLVAALAELASHLVLLPAPSILPPLGAGEDSVAVGLRSALQAEGVGDANAELSQTWRFLGGKFVDQADHALFVCKGTKPDDPTDVVGLWQWFSSEVRHARKRADELWEQIFHPME
jgi:hypothetical protein